jgi:hypothetical protein
MNDMHQDNQIHVTGPKENAQQLLLLFRAKAFVKIPPSLPSPHFGISSPNTINPSPFFIAVFSTTIQTSKATVG